MQYIGNILTPTPLDAGDLYNVTAERENLIAGIPTLIIGWETVKKMYPSASIIEWKIEDNVYWTYSKFEKRERYEDNLKKFYCITLKNLVETVEYVFFDILTAKEVEIEHLFKTLEGNRKKWAYINGNMAYIYYDGVPKVMGISIRDCEYLDKAIRARFFSTLYSKPNIKLLKYGDEISKEVKYKVRGREYLIPYLFAQP